MARGRYAPSPSGRLHLGNARTALLAWLAARAGGDAFVMRIEDLDPQRSRPEHERAILEDLRWLGLDWDEGPDVGGPHGPYRQSERFDLYAAALERLDTYPCTCTRREIREAVRAPHGATPVYPGSCRDKVGNPEREPAIRVRVPRGSRVEFTDAIAGPQAERLDEEVGDFVLRRNDDAWAYQLAVVVDDAAMGVEQVVRGADLLESTARQIWLFEALGAPVPSFAHVPLLVGADGEKLNKRHGATDLGQVRDAGVDPRRVVAALARSWGWEGSTRDCITPRELLEGFALESIEREPGRVALEALLAEPAPLDPP